MKVKLLKKWKRLVRQSYALLYFKSGMSKITYAMKSVFGHDHDLKLSLVLELIGSFELIGSAITLVLFEEILSIKLFGRLRFTCIPFTRFSPFTRKRYCAIWILASRYPFGMYGAVPAARIIKFKKKYEKYSRRYWSSEAKLRRAIESGSIS